LNRLSHLQAEVLRSAATAFSPRGRRASLLVLIFHQVPSVPDPMNPDEPDAAEFSAQADLVKALFNVLSLQEAAERLVTGSLPSRAACITFDDGYRNNLTVAAPILASRGLTATFFVATGYLGCGRMWNDTLIESVRRAPVQLDLEAIGLGRHEMKDAGARARVARQLLSTLKYLPPSERQRKADEVAERVGQPLPSDLMMSEVDVRELAQMGMEVGAHSVTHPILANVDDVTARREIVESRVVLEAIIGKPVTSFAYPNGRPQLDYAEVHARMVKEAGYAVAVSTAWGCAHRRSDPFQLPRLSPWDRTAGRYALRLLRAYAQR